MEADPALEEAGDQVEAPRRTAARRPEIELDLLCVAATADLSDHKLFECRCRVVVESTMDRDEQRVAPVSQTDRRREGVRTGTTLAAQRKHGPTLPAQCCEPVTDGRQFAPETARWIEGEASRQGLDIRWRSRSRRLFMSATTIDSDFSSHVDDDELTHLAVSADPDGALAPMGCACGI